MCAYVHRVYVFRCSSLVRSSALDWLDVCTRSFSHPRPPVLNVFTKCTANRTRSFSRAFSVQATATCTLSWASRMLSLSLSIAHADYDDAVDSSPLGSATSAVVAFHRRPHSTFDRCAEQTCVRVVLYSCRCSCSLFCVVVCALRLRIRRALRFSRHPFAQSPPRTFGSSVDSYSSLSCTHYCCVHACLPALALSPSHTRTHPYTLKTIKAPRECVVVVGLCVVGVFSGSARTFRFSCACVRVYPLVSLCHTYTHTHTFTRRAAIACARIYGLIYSIRFPRFVPS